MLTSLLSSPPHTNLFILLLTPHNYNRPQAIFFSSATLSGAFGGLLAYGLSKMAGVGGKGGWA